MLNMYNTSHEIGPSLEPMRAFAIIRKAVSLCFLAMVLSPVVAIRTATTSPAIYDGVPTVLRNCREHR